MTARKKSNASLLERLGALFSRDGLRRAGRLGLRLFLGISIAAAAWGALEARRRVEEDPRFRLSAWTLRLGEFPSWVTPEIRREIEAIGERGLLGPEAGDWTLFRRGLLAEIRAELLRNPWIRSVPRIRLNYPGIGAGGGPVAGGLEVDLELRRPIAAVRWRDRHVLCDGEGVALGSVDGPPPLEALGIPAIIGAADSGDPPRPGAVWWNRDVLEGIAVARELSTARIRQRFPGRRIESIDIRNVGGRLEPLECEILLRAVDPGAIGGEPLLLGWGRSPISRGARVLPVAEIIANLEKVLSEPRKYSGAALIRLYTAPMVGVTALNVDREP